MFHQTGRLVWIVLYIRLPSFNQIPINQDFNLSLILVDTNWHRKPDLWMATMLWRKMVTLHICQIKISLLETDRDIIKYIFYDFVPHPLSALRAYATSFDLPSSAVLSNKTQLTSLRWWKMDLFEIKIRLRISRSHSDRNKLTVWIFTVFKPACEY